MSFFKRRRLIVFRQVQLGILLFMLGLAISSAFVSATWGATLAANEDLTGAWQTMATLMATSLVLIGSWMYIGLYFTNRIFGPLYRLQLEMRAWRTGGPRNRITLRKGDFFQELIDDFNVLMSEGYDEKAALMVSAATASKSED